MFETNEALDKITEIHHQLSKTGIYKGYKSIIVMLSGLIGITAAVIQPFITKDNSSQLFVIYWAVIASINLVLCTGMIAYSYFFKETDYEKKQTLAVLMQFIPMIASGIIVTPFFTLYGREAIPFLPGIWALLFGMGILNVRPYLSNLTIFASLYYLICSIILLYLRFYNVNYLTLGMALTFGIGQFISATILYLSVEIKKYGKL